MKAFENTGISYIAKATSEAAPEGVLLDLNTSLKTPSISSRNNSLKNYGKPLYGRKKTRLLVRKGIESIALHLDDIVLIYTQNKLVFVIDQFAIKYICTKSLGELDDQFGGADFFRVNRQYLVNIQYIRSFKPYEKVKLLVGLTITQIKHLIVVSQETAPLFKKWIADA